MTRREATLMFWSWAASSPLLRGQSTPVRDSMYGPERVPPVDGIENAPEFEEAAKRRIAPDLFAHIAAGVGDERTLRRNREFFERITMRPRFLRDVSGVSLAAEIAGLPLSAPILVGPTARHARLNPEGEVATARGAAAAETVMVVSGRSDRTFKEIAAAKASLWSQSLPADSASPPASAAALVLTVDAPHGRVSDEDIQNRFEHAIERKGGGAVERADSWAALDALVAAAGDRPVFVKGLLDADEAKRAVAAGAKGVVVSNHGGRSVDGVPSAIEMLPAVRQALGPRATILVDGGFRRGSDILKGLAMGANAVLLGRPVLWALGAYGADGVQRLLELMRAELALEMALTGQATVAEISDKLVRIHRW